MASLNHTVQSPHRGQDQCREARRPVSSTLEPGRGKWGDTREVSVFSSASPQVSPLFQEIRATISPRPSSVGRA
jgi:hypothetical protein